MSQKELQSISFLVWQQEMHFLRCLFFAKPSSSSPKVMGSLPEAGQEDTIKWTPLDDEQEEVKEIDWKILSIDVPAERRHPQFGTENN